MTLLKTGRLASALIVFGCFVAAAFLHPHKSFSAFQVAHQPSPQVGVASAEPQFASQFASTDLQKFVHASSITALPDGDLIAVWFAGSREGAADVDIRGSRFMAAKGEWGEEIVFATRQSTQNGTGKLIRKLGNPVIALAPDNRLWLFYVSVSLGGWAASSINAQYSDDFGKTWTDPWQLVTSPFLNLSTLVRAAPVFHADGSIGLPVYHELLGKFAEYLYLNRDGKVIDKFRISHGNNSLQPTIVPLDELNAVAMLRYAGDIHHRVLASSTSDAGRTWTEPRVLDPSNPNSSLAAVATSGKGLLVALNDLRDGRFRLSLMSTDSSMEVWKTGFMLEASPDAEGLPLEPSLYREILAQNFRKSCGTGREGLLEKFLQHLDKRVCEHDGCNFEYAYPYFIRGADGIYHLVYSWNNSFIKHISFNDAWVEAQQWH
jgi:predicted neuraminidase